MLLLSQFSFFLFIPSMKLFMHALFTYCPEFIDPQSFSIRRGFHDWDLAVVVSLSFSMILCFIVKFPQHPQTKALAVMISFTSFTQLWLDDPNYDIELSLVKDLDCGLLGLNVNLAEEAAACTFIFLACNSFRTTTKNNPFRS